MCGSLHGTLRGMYNYKRVTVVQNAPDHKQRTLEPPALSLRTVETYVPLRAEGSESVPAVVCAFCTMSLADSKGFALCFFNIHHPHIPRNTVPT